MLVIPILGLKLILFGILQITYFKILLFLNVYQYMLCKPF